MNDKNRILYEKKEKAFFSYDDRKEIDIIKEMPDLLMKGNFKILQEISYKCTGQCPYCMNKELNLNEKEVPVKDYIAFYQKIIDNGGSIIELRITGGEPLQPNVIERTKQLVNYALNEPKIKKIQINSNGNWSIPEEWANKEKIIIQFSLDGDKDTINNNFGSNDLFDNLINNLNYCKYNNINFKFRCVINSEKDIEHILKILEKYKKLAIISWALPINSEYEKISKEEYIKRIKMTIEYEDYFQKNNINAMMRIFVGYCDQNLQPYYTNFMITPSGKIGPCAYLASRIQTNLSIYNFPFNDIYSFRKIINKIQKDLTCDFPNGFLKFWNSLTEKEKKELEFYINTPHRAYNMPSLKKYYNLT